DASEDGSRKLDQAWRVGRQAEGSGLAGVRLPLDRAALSVALGRDNVVHLALTDAAAAARLAVPLGRLMRFLGLATTPAARASGWVSRPTAASSRSAAARSRTRSAAPRKAARPRPRLPPPRPYPSPSRPPRPSPKPPPTRRSPRPRARAARPRRAGSPRSPRP